MDLKAFAEWVRGRWAIKAAPTDLAVAGLGLCGEAGEVVEHIKKLVRDRTGTHVLDRDALKLELGDVLHYWAYLATHFNIDVQEIIDANIAKLTAREARETLPNYMTPRPPT